MAYSLPLSFHFTKKEMLPVNLFAELNADTVYISPVSVFRRPNSITIIATTFVTKLEQKFLQFLLFLSYTIYDSQNVCDRTTSTSDHHCQWFCHSSRGQRLAKPRIQLYEICVFYLFFF